MSWESFLHGNEWYWRLARTVVQAVVGVIVAELDQIVAGFNIDETLKPIIVAAVMAILSPLMSALGSHVAGLRAAKIEGEVKG